ncbi:MAG: DNA-binding domain-containing protein, partial [Gammaproteobacteria bacterium]|nr:DNA-binding domain-containing protein [Gammaproteobacteria bacterium]
MKLAELQNDFQHALFDTECKGVDWISESARGLSARDRLDIYYNAYRIRLIDVLLDTFAHTAIYLGDDWFNQLAGDYVQTHPSIHKNIGLYGKDFPCFLAEQLPEDKEIS